MKKIFSLFLVLGLLAGAACSSEDKKDDKAVDKKEEKKKGVYAIGEVVEAGDFTITVNSVRVSEGSTYAKPDEGKIYFVMDVTIENMTDEDESISSMLQFELVDADGRKQDLSIFADNNGTMDGTASANGKLTGEIAYETAAEGELTLKFKADAFGGKAVSIKVR